MRVTTSIMSKKHFVPQASYCKIQELKEGIPKTSAYAYKKSKDILKAFTAVELKSYSAILTPLIYQKCLAAVVVKQKIFADLLQCTSIDVHCSTHLKKKKRFFIQSSY